MIERNYLETALRDLNGVVRGAEACSVFHEFAVFCHTQLESPDTIEDLKRSERFRKSKLAESKHLEAIIKGNFSEEEKTSAKRERSKAKMWLSIDEREHKDLKRSRDQFLKRSLDHYLLALAAGDQHDTDTLSFVAIWLKHAAEDGANEAVDSLISKVPTRKFVKVMNQLASRLQDITGNKFQRILSELVERICTEHPYHGMHFVFAGSKTTGGNDKTAMSRHAAATQIAYRLKRHPELGKTWNKIHRANELYIDLANFKLDEMRPNMKLVLRKYPPSRAVEGQVPEFGIPPITLELPVRDDTDYRHIPLIASFKPEMTIAGGLSAPKILSVVTTAGSTLRQLVRLEQYETARMTQLTESTVQSRC